MGSQNWSTCDMKLVHGQYGCFVADLSLLTCIDDEMMIMNGRCG